MKAPAPTKSPPLELETRWKPILTLSPAEYEVFLYMGEGMTTEEIAEARHGSLKTVESHIAHIKDKLGIERGTTLRCYAARFLERIGKPKVTDQVCERRLIFEGEEDV